MLNPCSDLTPQSQMTEKTSYDRKHDQLFFTNFLMLFEWDKSNTTFAVAFASDWEGDRNMRKEHKFMDSCTVCKKIIEILETLK